MAIVAVEFYQSISAVSEFKELNDTRQHRRLKAKRIPLISTKLELIESPLLECLHFRVRDFECNDLRAGVVL